MRGIKVLDTTVGGGGGGTNRKDPEYALEKRLPDCGYNFEGDLRRPQTLRNSGKKLSVSGESFMCRTIYLVSSVLSSPFLLSVSHKP